MTNSFWEQTYGSFDHWRQYIRSESEDAFNDIWSDAEPLVEYAVNDIKYFQFFILFPV